MQWSGVIYFLTRISAQQKQMDKKNLLNIRRRTQPRIHDFCYLHCRSHLRTLESFINRLYDRSTSNPVVLDVGCGCKPFEERFSEGHYIGVDIDPDSAADFVLDCNKDSFPTPKDSVDGVILSNTLEHIFDISHLLAEICRVLKPGGLIYFSVPMTFPVHAHPDDYYRFTPHYFERSFSGWEILQLNVTNSVFSTPLLWTAQVLETFLPTWITFLPITLLNSCALLLDHSTKMLFGLMKANILMRVWSGGPLEINGLVRKPHGSKLTEGKLL